MRVSLAILLVIAAAARADWLDPYNVVWDAPSASSADSMPLSGLNLGLNVWVESNDVLVLLGSPDCMDENGMQVKLGLIRLKFTPDLFGTTFRQELRLGRSEIVIGGDEGRVTLWCDMQRPAVHAEVDARKPVAATASYETWSAYQATNGAGHLQWVRRLPEENPRRLRDLKAQGMEEFSSAVPDPLSKLTMGGRLDAPGLVPAEATPGKFNGMDTKVCAVRTAAPVKKLDLTFTFRMEQDASLAAWEKALAMAAGQRSDRAAALAWWREFWDRSHIVIKPGAKPDDKDWQVGRNYQLFRYMLAGNSSGRAMTLFNGGLFTCDGNPDRRNWDGCQFMAQNQRLVYWPMLRAGDFDLLQVATDFYRDRTEMSRLHAKKFWNVDGVAWTEPFSIFGLDAIGATADGRSQPSHLRYHHTSGMEFALMMLEMERYTGKELPGYRAPAEGIIAYYDQFYGKRQPLDQKGKLVIYPSDACEPYHGCTNNTDVIAGLTALTRELLARPLPAAERDYLEGFKKRIPDFAIREKDGRKYYAAAESWEWVFHNGNMDFPQMYVCFPFNIAALGRPGLDLADATWEFSAVNPGVQRQNQCWYQSAINLARLGRTDEARTRTRQKFLHSSARFPAFWRNPGFCHTPDSDHGGSAMIALQEMLMQTDGRRILLAPAWPADWDCDFKLHAPYQTVVEGRISGGQVILSRVTPKSRSKDIEILGPTPTPPIPVSQGKAATASTVWHQAGYDPGKAVDGDTATRWGSAQGAREGWLEVDLGKPTAVSRAVLVEIAYPSTSRFTIEALGPDNAWRTTASGSTIGAHRELNFEPVTAQRFRLHILEASDNLNVEEFQLFEPGSGAKSSRP